MNKIFPAFLISAALAFTACGVGPDKSREDAHDTVNVDKDAPHSIAFNNHYPNVETKCDGAGHRVYVTTSGYGYIVVIPDVSCPNSYIKGAKPQATPDATEEPSKPASYIKG